ncbi:MAG: NADH-quinone oxidoreductase subunit H [Nanoarchaeota archaeon]|nr:NADH-quinone oxidoreductase subunit H [Nanoarchaeota archaeon]MBU1135028.1 NADH-quinone oxidoreductase subunit H [Nanoarchaeota archaeon]MBU2520154.1 NADH-quinone oxidoreductase subunit H [Nanoarchaeota archaeon]
MIEQILPMLFSILVYPGVLFLFVGAFLYAGILRKLAARMQNRVGPPIWQPFLDFIKLLGKQDITPIQAKIGFTLWPLVAIASVTIAGLITPIAGVTALGSGDIILLVYFLSLASLSLYMAGFASANPFGVVGAKRGITQMLAYEFPFIVSLLVPIIFVSTLSPFAVNLFQLQYGWVLHFYPLAGIAYFISILAKAEIPPFHVPEAHQEIVSGYSTEYTGTRLAMIDATHMLKLFVLIALGVAMFYGGSGGILGFLLKSLIILLFVVLSRVLMVRLRIDHVLKFCWIFGFIALIDLVRLLFL